MGLPRLCTRLRTMCWATVAVSKNAANVAKCTGNVDLAYDTTGVKLPQTFGDCGKIDYVHVHAEVAEDDVAAPVVPVMNAAKLLIASSNKSARSDKRLRIVHDKGVLF